MSMESTAPNPFAHVICHHDTLFEFASAYLAMLYIQHF